MSRALQADRPIRTDDLLIRQKVEAMIEYGHVAVRQFPKMERHVLGAEIRHTMWALLRLVVVCNKRYHKKTTLQELDAELDLLRCPSGIAWCSTPWSALSSRFGSGASSPTATPAAPGEARTAAPIAPKPCCAKSSASMARSMP